MFLSKINCFTHRLCSLPARVPMISHTWHPSHRPGSGHTAPDLEPTMLFEMEMDAGGKRGRLCWRASCEPSRAGHIAGAQRHLESDGLRRMTGQRRPSKAWVSISFFLFTTCSQISPPLFPGWKFNTHELLLVCGLQELHLNLLSCS